MDLLIERRDMPSDILDSVKMFWDVRNKIIHGMPAGIESDNDMMRVIDIGVRILNTIKAIHRGIKTVYYTNVEIYSDAACNNIRKDIKGIMLESTNSSDANKTYEIYPTTKNNYKIGERVSWEWNMGMIIGESWYKHPETGQITFAWSQSAEFIGRHLTDI